MTYTDLENVQPLPWRTYEGIDGLWRVIDANDVTVFAGVTEQEARIICEAVNSYHRHLKLEEVAAEYQMRAMRASAWNGARRWLRHDDLCPMSDLCRLVRKALGNGKSDPRCNCGLSVFLSDKGLLGAGQ